MTFYIEVNGSREIAVQAKDANEAVFLGLGQLGIRSLENVAGIVIRQEGSGLCDGLLEEGKYPQVSQ